LLVESGLTPLAALQAATRNAAIFMNAADRYGTVSKGKIADLVLLDANPVQDIHNTTKIAEVFLNGTEFDRKALDGILRAAETTAMASDQSAGSKPPDIASNIEMQQLSRILAGRWSGKLAMEPGSRESGRADEAWYLTPGADFGRGKSPEHSEGGFFRLRCRLVEPERAEVPGDLVC
jgi:Amidohydrolase family